MCQQQIVHCKRQNCNNSYAVVPVACTGFILAGAEFFFMGAEKNQGGRLAPEGRKKKFCPPLFFSAPPAEFNSAPGAEQARGGAENLIIPRERGRNIL